MPPTDNALATEPPLLTIKVPVFEVFVMVKLSLPMILLATLRVLLIVAAPVTASVLLNVVAEVTAKVLLKVVAPTTDSVFPNAVAPVIDELPVTRK